MRSITNWLDRFCYDHPNFGLSELMKYIAIGNVVGSNIFNVFFILGTSAIIKHLPVYPGIEIDAALVAVSALAVWLLLCNKNRSINRWGGALLLVLYAGYLTYRLLTY